MTFEQKKKKNVGDLFRCIGWNSKPNRIREFCIFLFVFYVLFLSLSIFIFFYLFFVLYSLFLPASLWISFYYAVSPPPTSHFSFLPFTSSFLLLPHLSSYLPFQSFFLSFITSVTASAWDYKRRVLFFFSKEGRFQKSFK